MGRTLLPVGGRDRFGVRSRRGAPPTMRPTIVREGMMSDWNSGAGENAPTPHGFPAPGAPAGGFLPPSQPVYAGQAASPPGYLGAPGASPLTPGPAPEHKRSR